VQREPVVHASEVRNEGGQRCNLWITRYFKIRSGDPRPDSLRVSNAQNIIVDFGYQTFHALATFSRGSAAKTRRPPAQSQQPTRLVLYSDPIATYDLFALSNYFRTVALPTSHYLGRLKVICL
jgi:hypothetical protein